MRKVFLLMIVSFCFTLGCKTTYKNTSILSNNIDAIKVEANTNSIQLQPKGVSVNVHGVALDTDGDGITDNRDKELLTLQKCFPVDSNGVGNCPKAACCKEFDMGIVDGFRCHIGSVEIKFAHKSKVLTDSAKLVLGTFAEEIKANPECKIRIGTGGASTK